jgi:pyrroline-5-carboxylate reductase
MRLGFLGTGTITSAIVTGLQSGGCGHAVRLSPRNAQVAAELARRFPAVSIAPSNQDVLDASDVVVLAIRPQVARAVLSELRFRPGHHVISLVGAFPLAVISELVRPSGTVTRAVPLPATAKRRSPTAIYPRDPLALELFALLGPAFEVDTETEFNALCTATSTMASYFAFAESITAWLVSCGLEEPKARNYVAYVFSGLADTAIESPERSFGLLACEHATPGGLNEQVRRHLAERGLFDAVSEGLDAVMRRVTAGS